MLAIFPETLSYAEKGMVEHIAISTRKTYEKKVSPRLDLKHLIGSMGIRIESTKYHSLAALAVRDEKGRFSVSMIVSNQVDRDQADVATLNFLLAHMLGHYLIHLQPLIARGDLEASGYRETACPLKRYASGGHDLPHLAPSSENGLELKREWEGDQFAAALLMPKGMILHAWKKVSNLDKICGIFGVTKPCLIRRLEDLGAMTRQPQNFLEAESSLSHKMDLKETSNVLTAPPFSRQSTDQEPQNQKKTSPVSAEQASQAGLRGMARIREIAKMLDKNQT